MVRHSGSVRGWMVVFGSREKPSRRGGALLDQVQGGGEWNTQPSSTMATLAATKELDKANVKLASAKSEA